MQSTTHLRKSHPHTYPHDIQDTGLLIKLVDNSVDFMCMKFNPHYSTYTETKTIYSLKKILID